MPAADPPARRALPRRALPAAGVRLLACAPALVALLAVALFAVVVRLQPGGPDVARAIDDVGQVLAAVLSSAACLARARRSRARLARPWLWLAAGSGAWAAGATAWSSFELIAGQQTPFPSVADVGYLLFPLAAVAGLLSWPSATVTGRRRWRLLLDGALVAGALFIISWVSALGEVVRGGGDSPFVFAVSLAYPVGDLVLLTVTVVILAHARHAGGSGLGPLAAGLVSLALADSGFAYLTAQEAYATGSVVDIGWFAGFLLIALAAGSAGPDSSEDDTSTPAVESAVQALLPYLPAGTGLAVAVTDQLHGRPDRLALIAATLVIAALLARQVLATLDNRRLVRQLVDAHDALHHQAFHDPLTGLANRALFADRLRHGVDLHRRDLRPLGLLYCDLDGFKAVNDHLGHDVGDAVLKVVAERLRATARTGDTIARLGGDEFALLVEDGTSAADVAARVLDAFARPAFVGQQRLPLSVSIGITELLAHAVPVDAEVLLQRADAAMYQAKRDGKGVAHQWQDAALPQQRPAPRRAGA